MDGVGNSSLDRLRKLLLNLLGNDGSLAVVLSVGLVGALAGPAAGRVNLGLSISLQSWLLIRLRSYGVGKALLNVLRDSLLGLLRNGGVA